jgi:intein/homing endonuclease
MTLIINELNKKALGGTELLAQRLYGTVSSELLDKFQIWFSRFREADYDPAKFQIYYAHDLPLDPESAFLADGGWKRFHKLIFVSNWQMNLYQIQYQIPFSRCEVMLNSITPIEVPEIKPAEKIKIGYWSTPHRGLNILIPVFCHLAEKYDNIELDVFSSFRLYGWEQRDEPYQNLFQQCIDHPRINYHGSVGNDVIRKYAAQAHIFALPSIWPETSCEPAGTKILTKSGVKKIEDIIVDDLVLTHTGQFQRVTRLSKRHYSGDIHNLKFIGNTSGLFLTGNHPVLVTKRGLRSDCKNQKSVTGKLYHKAWKPVEELQSSDTVTRVMQREGNLESINISEWTIFPHSSVVDGKITNNKAVSTYKKLPDYLELNKELAWVLGLFAGDGCASISQYKGKERANTLAFSHHSRERPNAERIVSYFGEGVIVDISKNEIKTLIYNSIWTRFLNQNIGVGSQKKIPDFLWDAPFEIQREFINGYFDADGYTKANGSKTIQGISPSLIYGTVQLLTNQGIHASIRREDKTNTWCVTWHENSQKRPHVICDGLMSVTTKPTTIQKYDDFVYNFAVEHDESYVAETIVVHNCLCLMEAMSARMACVHSNYGALFETAANWSVMYQFDEDLNIHAAKFQTALESAILAHEHPTIQSRLKSQKAYADVFYNWSVRASEWEMLLQQIIDSPPATVVPNNGESENGYQFSTV